MRINTTVNISENTRFRIVYAARITNTSGSSVVTKIMKNVMREHDFLIEENRAVRYQEKTRGENWCKLHVALFMHDYRYFADMRNFFRCSVSLLLSYAVNKYLDKYILSIHKKLKNIEGDNYLFNNYILTKSLFDTSICWTIYWGIPPNPQDAQLQKIRNPITDDS